MSLNAHLYYTVAHKVSLSPTHKKTQNSRQRPMIDLSPRTKDQEPETMGVQEEGENSSSQKNTTIRKIFQNILKGLWK